MADKITFSFGENWSEYKKKASPEQFDASLEDLETWLGTENIKGKRILDIRCGSEVHSSSLGCCLVRHHRLVER